MNLDPIKSALSFREIGETSLAVPSDGASHSGQQRVKEQVSTMTRSKHKYSVRGSAGTISPTSPKSDSVFYETKYSPTNPINGSAFTYDSSMANGNVKMKQQKQSVMQRSVSTKSASYQRNQSNSMLPNSLPALNQLSLQPEFHATPSLGNSALSSAQYKQAKTLDRRYSHLSPNSPNQIVTVNTIQKTSNSSQLYGSQFNSRQPLSPQSNLEHRHSVISRGKMDMNGLNGEAHSADISLSEAVRWLTLPDENYQLHGASIIQHSTFTDDKAKAEVRKLQGISPLVSLLNSPHPQIQEVTASALRNIVFKDSANKEEVRRQGGVNEALNLLQNTDSPEIQKHVTGLLWNLSSADNVQPELIRQALPVLTERILKLKDSENSSWISINPDAHTESFYHATGCLRNLSSGKLLQNRQALRNCDGLIDSLVTHVQTCTNNDLLDSKSLENCVCILHNLTYQLDTETPNMFSKLNSFAKNVESQNNTPDTGPIGCFSNQSRKAQSESNIIYPAMDVSNPKGKDHLIHSDTLMSYLKLLSTSENTAIQEACCGILHNLTAKKGIVSDVMSHIIVQKLNGAQYLTPILQSKNASLKNAAIKLMGNLARTPRLQKQLARQSLPDVVSTLRSGFPYGADLSPDSDSVIATACQVTNNLVRADPDVGKKLLSTNLINSLNDISQNISLPNASKAAGILLHNLWSDKTIQPVLRKIGMTKKSFVNDITSAALKSVQVVD